MMTDSKSVVLSQIGGKEGRFIAAYRCPRLLFSPVAECYEGQVSGVGGNVWLMNHTTRGDSVPAAMGSVRSYVVSTGRALLTTLNIR